MQCFIIQNRWLYQLFNYFALIPINAPLCLAVFPAVPIFHTTFPIVYFSLPHLTLFLIPLFFYLFYCLVLSCLIDVVSLVIFVSLSVSVLQSYFDSTLSAGPNKFVLFAIVNCFCSFYSVRTHVVCVYLPLPHSLSISR